MRRANKVLLTMGSAMLISSGAAMAGPPAPMGYNQYTASGGSITATCPTGATCGTAITGNGFYQRSVSIGSNTYFQTIVLPTGATVSSAGDIAGLSFADENFVQQGGGTGIADNQHLFASGTSSNPGDFTADTAINSGWANTGGDVIALSQTVVDSSAGFNLGFSLTGDGTNTTSLSVTQDVSLGSSDLQKFDLRQVTAAAGGDTSGFALPDGGTISWTAGQVIQAVWMGQAVTAGPSQQLSGFQGYTNVSTDVAATYTDQVTTGPWNYDTTDFGSAPSFP
jgi:hypothetical protein